MKKETKAAIVLILILFFSTTIISADVYINGENITKMKDIKILELLETKKSEQKKTDISIKFGQQKNYLMGKGYLTKKNGKKINFKNILDTLKYLQYEGWEKMDSYLHCKSGDQIYHFLLSRKNTK
ncbi:MAG: hypothetical protein ABFR75_12655 [Acidobacteriota bacterium]